MGSDKALLSLGEQTMLQRALQTAAEAADTVCIVGPQEKYAAFGDVVADIYQGCGPLGGIHAALSATRACRNSASAKRSASAFFAIWNAARDSVTKDFAPVKDSRIGELAAQFDIVLGVTPEG